MTSNQNIQHEVITGITSEQTKSVTFSREFRAWNDNKPCNWLIVWNRTTQNCLIQLNNQSSERIPLPKNGGLVVINKEDSIKFSDIQIIEIDAGADAVNKFYITYGVLPERKL